MSLFDELQNSTVGELVLREAPTVTPRQAVRDAVQVMREKKLGCVFVVDEQWHPIGIFNEAMLRMLLALNPGDLDALIASQMDPQVPHVYRDDPVLLMLEAMDRQNTRFLAVLDKDHRLVALTGQKGLMEFIATYYPYEVLVQSLAGSTPTEREGA